MRGGVGVHSSEVSWVVANTNRVEVALYLPERRWAITWVVMTAESKVLMFSPADAKWLGQVLVRLAEEVLEEW